ncbi:MAG: excinuclease ABC subunit UvrB [Bacteroidota bacterium]
MAFRVYSEFEPAGDQPSAIAQLSEGLHRGDPAQVLLGVTGSGKTFTMAKVVENIQRPTLVLTHNKTLVAQLYGEFRQFFPDNAVEYFVSYYDYYQPEAYLPSTGTYIEKDLSINDEIEKLRLRTTSSLMSGRRDVLVVASVSCIYGMGNPADYTDKVIRLNRGLTVSIEWLLHRLVDVMYSRTLHELTRGTFRVRGETVDVYPAYTDHAYRLEWNGNRIESLSRLDPESGRTTESLDDLALFPASNYVTSKNELGDLLLEIQKDMVAQVAHFKKEGRFEEARRIEDRVTFDVEMIRELGYCSGIENYSRYLDRRKPGDRPFCLLDYFPSDFLLLIDESHQTLPQVRAMYGGDRSRKLNLVEYGFRLPAALDNRPLMFGEFESLIPQVIYVSATPGDYELQHSDGVVVEQVVRPTGLLDPPIEIRPVAHQVDDLMEEIRQERLQGHRVLVTTLTKRMAEELSRYLVEAGVACTYLHSGVETLERVEILRDLRLGKIEVLIGVNLLREGLDLPEVALVAIMDADKEGFLRNYKSLTQTAGRAARHEQGRVLFYADRMTGSMQATIDECQRRRQKQEEHNKKHGIIPRSIRKSDDEIRRQSALLDIRNTSELTQKPRTSPTYSPTVMDALNAAEPGAKLLATAPMNDAERRKISKQLKKEMNQAVKEMDFLLAAQIRDRIHALEQKS